MMGSINRLLTRLLLYTSFFGGGGGINKVWLFNFARDTPNMKPFAIRESLSEVSMREQGQRRLQARKE